MKDPAERCIRFLETYCKSPKGVGHGKPLKLAPFQKAWIRSALAPGIRESVLSAPRGTGKSTLLAGMALWGTFDKNPDGQPIVRICASTVQQAIDAVYGVACLMIEAEPELSRRSLVRTGASNARIEVGYNKAECKPIANDEDTLQGLDFTMFILDEASIQPYEVWNAASGAGGKRTSSLMVGISTPSVNKDDSALWELRQIWLEGRMPPTFSFTELAAPDDCDIRDESLWRLAHPGIDEGYFDIEVYRNDVATKPEAWFRTYRLGQWVEGQDCWLGVDGRQVWRGLTSKYQLKPGADTWVGIDVGLSRDTTAVVVGQWNGKVFHTTAKIWQPTPNGSLDVTAVEKYVRELGELYNLIEVAFDPRLFERSANDLADEGYPMVLFHQSVERMVPACGDLFESIKRGEVSHDGAADYERQILNAMPTYTDTGFRLTKRRSRGRIDAAVALAMCHSRAEHPEPQLPAFVCL
ncbi:phage terminase [Mycobacteroides abscessus subsp. abscessus]|nr:phage terminase [Mycobacteroides abscessus subsp. abscessus]